MLFLTERDAGGQDVFDGGAGRLHGPADDRSLPGRVVALRGPGPDHPVRGCVLSHPRGGRRPRASGQEQHMLQSHHLRGAQLAGTSQ